jgi:hypothetical protein
VSVINDHREREPANLLQYDCKHNILIIQRKKLCALADHKFINVIISCKKSKEQACGSLQWWNVYVKFLQNQSSSFKVEACGQTNAQTQLALY